ncbi:PIG-L deacetylase family protein [Pelagicoccus albus]|uniref:PIG-L family deacetylase n=1 Tax=Pelagicoccus albus TaxID=415222 RepID=A0A7X1E9K1_9BACT|nr:PIG-L family deacetylase [Pelagicoccus albus]MBC2607504.1 PIG-L family deacetylase [Pelagicoccus albus]
MKDFYVPDGVEVKTAFERTTHLAVGAHQDDLEIFAYHGIAECYESQDAWFGGVTVTNGAGSARTGKYADFTDEEMQAKRVEEQREAAKIGKYSFQAQLAYPSSDLKSAEKSEAAISELEAYFRQCKADTVYLHNPADKHDTHISLLTCCVAALRRLPEDCRPKRVYGCEVWRDLDWLSDSSKVMLPVDKYPELAEKLIEVFDSQVAGGKDYVAATIGRRNANATYFDSHSIDQSTAYTVAIDMMPLLENPELSMDAFVGELIEAFKKDACDRLTRYQKA